MIQKILKSKYALYIFSFILASCILSLDLILQLGVAGCVPYTVFVLLGWLYNKRNSFFHLAIIASILTITGYIFSPNGGIEWIILTNRAYAIFSIWITAIVSWYWSHNSKKQETEIPGNMVILLLIKTM